MRHKSPVDALTGVPGRAYLRSQLENFVRRALQQGTTFSIFIIDLDNFKTLNDMFGHETGDRVLVEWTQLLRRTLRPTDEIIRYGGDEFVVLLPHTTRSEAQKVGQKILDTLQKNLVAGHSLGASIGIATYPVDDTDPYTLLALADQALYQAKSQGKFRIGTPEWQDPQFTWPVPFVSRTIEERALRDALERDYPIVLVTGPTGIGKSRLISHVLQQSSHPWVRVSAYPGESDPFRQLVKDLSGSLTVLKKAIQEAVPEGRLLVENIQWMNKDAWDLLFLLILDKFQAILTLRWEEYRHFVARYLHQAFRLDWVVEVPVGPLGQGQVESLVRRALQSRPPAGLVEDVRRLSGGNPYLVGQVLRSLHDKGLLIQRKIWQYKGCPPGFTPTSLEDLWWYRIHRLSPDAKKVLGLLGLLGGEISQDIFEIFEEELDISALDELTESGLVNIDGEKIQLRESIWSGFAVRDLPEDLRRRWARILWDRGEHPPAAHRVWLAFQAGRQEEGWRYIHEIMEGARRKGNPRQVFEVLHLVDLESLSHKAATGILLGEAWASRFTGNYERALEILEKHRWDTPEMARMWLEILVARGEAQRAVKESYTLEQRFPDPEARIGFVVERIWALINLGKSSKAKSALYPLLNRIPRNHPDRGRVLNLLGQVYRRTGNSRGAHRAFSRALEIYERLGDLWGKAAIYTNWSLLFFDKDQFVEAEERLKSAMAIYEQLEYPEGLVATKGNLASVYAYLGYAHIGVRLLQDAIDLTLSIGFYRPLPILYHLMGTTLANLGEMERALGYAQRALEEATRQGTHQIPIQALRVIARIQTRRGAFEEARTALLESERIARQVNLSADTFWILYERLFLASAEKNTEEVREILSQLESIREDFSKFMIVHIDLEAAHLAAQDQQKDRAMARLERARRALSRLQSPMLQGMYYAYRGEVLCILGNKEAGIRDLEKAIDIFRNLGLDYWTQSVQERIETYTPDSSFPREEHTE